MTGAELSVQEIREVVRACAHIRVPDPAPPYMKRFLVLRIAREDPSLADKVDHLPPNGCAELFHLIRLLQDAAREE